MSMIVYGGQMQSKAFSNEILIYDLEYNEWHKVNYKKQVEPIIQAQCCTVRKNVNGTKSNALLQQPANHHAFGECVKEGIYMFGGKNEKGHLCNKMRLLKVTINP